MIRINFYCTEILAAWLKKKYGGDSGRAGRMSANIERMLWWQVRAEQEKENTPKEKTGLQRRLGII